MLLSERLFGGENGSAIKCKYVEERHLAADQKNTNKMAGVTRGGNDIWASFVLLSQGNFTIANFAGEG